MPGSKSHTIRAVAIGSLAAGDSVIRRPLVSGDTLSAVQCYRALGAKIDTSDSNLYRRWQFGHDASRCYGFGGSGRAG
jgi:3-phosphoshikimate 1-carboxyvinyltransferase